LPSADWVSRWPSGAVPAANSRGDRIREPPKPRRFLLDKPFLRYLKEKNADEPYFVIWIANAELMESIR
jgi:hypothetical protein